MISKIKKWWKYHRDQIIWKKQLDHFWTTVIDDWGISEDESYKYRIDVYVYKTFSFVQGFGYQIKAPNIVINNRKLWQAFDEFMKYLYRGGCPCYYRLEEELRKKDLWRKL